MIEEHDDVSLGPAILGRMGGNVASLKSHLAFKVWVEVRSMNVKSGEVPKSCKVVALMKDKRVAESGLTSVNRNKSHYEWKQVLFLFVFETCLSN